MDSSTSVPKIKNKPISYIRHSSQEHLSLILKKFPKYLHNLSFIVEKISGTNPLDEPLSFSAVTSRIKRIKIIYHPNLKVMRIAHHRIVDRRNFSFQLVQNKVHSIKSFLSEKRLPLFCFYLKDLTKFSLNIFYVDHRKLFRRLPKLNHISIYETKIEHVARNPEGPTPIERIENPMILQPTAPIILKDLFRLKQKIHYLKVQVANSPGSSIKLLLNKMNSSDEYLKSLTNFEVELSKISKYFWTIWKFPNIFKYVSSLCFDNFEDHNILAATLLTIKASPRLQSLSYQEDSSKSLKKLYRAPLSFEFLQTLQSLDFNVPLVSQDFIYFVLYFSLPKSLKRLKLGTFRVDWKSILPEVEKIDCWNQIENPFEKDPLYMNFFKQLEQLNELESLTLSICSDYHNSIIEYFLQSILKRIPNLTSVCLIGINKPDNVRSILNHFWELSQYCGTALKQIQIQNFNINLQSEEEIVLIELDKILEICCLVDCHIKTDKLVIRETKDLKKFLKIVDKTHDHKRLTAKFVVNIDHLHPEIIAEELINFFKENIKHYRVELYIIWDLESKFKDLVISTAYSFFDDFELNAGEEEIILVDSEDE